LRSSLPRPADLAPDAYQRNLAARAFDVARYLLFLGVPTNVGQVVSITARWRSRYGGCGPPNTWSRSR